MLFKLSGVPCGWNICEKSQAWEVGWECDGKLKSRQELGHEGSGVGMPCQGVRAFSEDHESLLKVSKKSDQGQSPL